MKYHAPTKCFVITQEQLSVTADSIIGAIRALREIAGLPLEGYQTQGMLKPEHHAECRLLDIARFLDIDLGAGNRLGVGVLDVRE